MRIAFITQNYLPTDGLGRVTMALAEQMGETNDVHIFTRKVLPDEPTNTVIHKVPAFTEIYSVCTISFFFASWLWLFWRRFRFDIIHLQGWSFLKPDVMTIHSIFKAALQEIYSRDDFKDIVEKSEVDKNTIKRIEMITPVFEYNFGREHRYRRLIPVSTQVKNDLMRMHNVPESRIALIPNGVDTIYFHPDNKGKFRAAVRAELGLDEETLLFLFIGNDPRRKGLITVIESFIKADLPGSHLLAIGTDPYSKNAFDKPKKISRDAGFEERITFLGEQKDANRYFAAADVFLFPSIYETYGLVVIEAMASGLPVITSRTGAFPEIVDHGVNGFLLDDASDVEGMAGYMKNLHASDDLRERMAAAGRRTALENTWDKQVRKTLSLYEEILKEKRSGA